MEFIDNVSVKVGVNIYCDGKVQSRTLRYPDGKVQTLGVYLPGEFEFHSDGAETVLVTAGCAYVLFPGDAEFRAVAEGARYDVPANTVFKVRCDCITEYICDFL